MLIFERWRYFSELQENLIMSHAAGVGKPLTQEQTRMLMALRINVLAKGYRCVPGEMTPITVEACSIARLTSHENQFINYYSAAVNQEQVFHTSTMLQRCVAPVWSGLEEFTCYCQSNEQKSSFINIWITSKLLNVARQTPTRGGIAIKIRTNSWSLNA